MEIFHGKLLQCYVCTFFAHTLSQESSIFSKYFLEDKEAQIKMSRWIRKESEHQFYFRRPYIPCEYIFNLFQGERIHVLNKDMDSFFEELEVFGIPIPEQEWVDEEGYYYTFSSILDSP